MEIFDLPEERRFEIRLQVALLRNAERISEVSSNPSKFAAYIEERKRKIADLCGPGEIILYKGDQIYP